MSWGGKRNNIVFISIVWHSENVGIYNWEASRPLQSLVPLCAPCLCSHFLLSCAWSCWCWFRTQCTSHSPVCDGALQRSCCAAPWLLGLPEDSALRWEHSDTVLAQWHSPGTVTLCCGIDFWLCGRFQGVVWWRWTVHRQRYKPTQACKLWIPGGFLKSSTAASELGTDITE